MSTDDEEIRMKVFIENIETISRHNALFDNGNASFRIGINQFADKTFEEFSEANKAIKIYDEVPFHPATYKAGNNLEIPASYDWREIGAVTKVKDQIGCGSCYAMAAIDSIESQLLIQTGILMSLSVQEIIDCAGDYETWGCDGGVSYRVFDYVRDNGGISSGENYPYQGVRGACDRLKYPKIPIDLKGYVELPSQDVELLKTTIVNIGPIIISIDIDHETFMRYSSGIYHNSECSHETNHAVLLIGYGRESNQDYWLVKNSFGVTWGEFGYMKLARNNEDLLKIAIEPFFPLVI